MAVPPDQVRFCLRCGTTLSQRSRFGAVRPVCPSCGYTHFFDPKVAVAVMVERDGKLLMVRRANTPQKGLWTVPGGFMDADETPEQTAARECVEETGLEVRIAGLFDVVSGKEHDAGASFVMFYRAEITGGELRPSDDADMAGWFGPDELPEIAFNATCRALTRWAAEQRG